MRLNAYVAVFGIIAIVVVAAGVSVLLPFLSPSQSVENASNLPNLGPAPNFQGIAAWINTQPLNITGLRGKVVLVDFWTYSCINCIRTIPYLNAWFDKYGNDGLVIVGVHTPEFQFEKNYSNVLAAVRSFGIKYPVALDSNSATWNAYNNHYWPEDYLIDAKGNIRETHIGEGGYNTTETLIRGLLQSAGYNVSAGVVANSVNATSVNFAKIGTPEIYVGYNTARSSIGNPQGFSPNQVVNYTVTGNMNNNTVYFSGEWYNAPDGMVSVGNGSRLFLIYQAKDVNVVAEGNSSVIEVRLDGNNLPPTYVGSDVILYQGVASVKVDSARLYNVVDGPSYGWHELEIIAGPGFKLYTFTFG